MKSLLVVAVQPSKYMFEKSISVVVYYRAQVEKNPRAGQLDSPALYVIGRLFENSQFFRAGLKNPNHLILVMINHDEDPAILAIKDLVIPTEVTM